jgi:hypothetical protein
MGRGMSDEYGEWTDWLLCLGIAVLLGARWPMRNPEGHTPNWWRKHPEARAAVASQESQSNEQDRSAEPKHRGLDLLLPEIAIVAELVAVAYGHTWLGWFAGWFAALFFFAAFWEYTKAYLKHRHWGIEWGVRLIALVALAVGTMFALRKMEQNIRAHFLSIPKVNFSMNDDKVITIDNSKGTNFSTFK